VGWNDGIMVSARWWSGLAVAMWRTWAADVSLWEAVLRLPEGLAQVDVSLDDPVFFRAVCAVLRPAGVRSVDAD